MRRVRVYVCGPGLTVVVGDTIGRLRTVRYPCVSSHSVARASFGHGGAVRRVRWSSDDAYVVSLGGADRCVFQWRAVRSLDGPATVPPTPPTSKVGTAM